MKHERECFITFPITEKRVENTTRSEVFLMNFEFQCCLATSISLLGHKWISNLVPEEQLTLTVSRKFGKRRLVCLKFFDEISLLFKLVITNPSD